MSIVVYGLQYTSPKGALPALCEVERNVIYQVGTHAAMQATADDCAPTACYKPVPLPWAGEVPDWFQPDPRPEAVVSQTDLCIDDDMGSRTSIRTITSSSLLSIRRTIRDLNPGRIPIYSDYDCTGLLCYQSCKIIKLYRSYAGEYVALVECHAAHDV